MNFLRFNDIKSPLLAFVAVIYCLPAFCQEVDSFEYQTLIHYASGKVVLSKVVSLKLSIIEGNINGSFVYGEEHKVKTDESGMVSVSIGSGSEKTGKFTDIDWSEGNYFLKVEIDTAGGTNYTDKSTVRILRIPSSGAYEPLKETSLVVIEDELFISRKYVGKFIDFRQTGPKTNNGPNLIWIKTSMESTFGKISAYGKKCDFSVGDNLYIKRTYYSPGGVSGYWVYQVENDSSKYYRVTDFQHDHKVPIEKWFN
jgi:hypothetical protein